MKRRDLIQHLRAHGCGLLREGRGHSVWVNPASWRQSAVPRHREIGDYTARAICRQLGIPEPYGAVIERKGTFTISADC